MRILAVSHSCVLAVNQKLFVELAKLPDIELLLVAPQNWVSEYDAQPLIPKAGPDVTFPMVFSPVWKPGHVWLHGYRKLPVDQINAFDPDLVYCAQEPWSLSNFQFLSLAKKRKTPFLFHTNQNLVKRLHPPFHQLEQSSYAGCAAALAYSEEARKVMETKGLKRPSFVVPYATNVAQFFPGREPELRASYGVADSVVLGYLGRFVPEKGLDLLIEAGARLIQSGKNLRLLFVGAGPEREALENLARERGIADRVHFPGGVAHDKAGEAMRCFDLLGLPSRTRPNWKEQFGRVLIEAWATGIPVVGSDSGEIPNLIRATGGGLIFREDDVDDLTEKLGALVDSADERKKRGESGVRAVVERYTFEAVAAQTAELFRRFARSKPAG